MGQLRVISDHLEGKFGLPPKPWKVGRGNDCDIQLVHKSVSRHHCVLTQKDEKLRLEDLGSTYGTYINGAQVSDGYAKIGDKVRFGRIICVFEELGTDTVVGKVPVAEPLDPPKDDIPVAPVIPSENEISPTPPSPPASPPPASPAAAAKSVQPAESAKPEFKLAPPASKKKQAPAKPKLPAGGPVARFKGDPKPEAEEEPAAPAAKPKKAAGGVFSRLHGGHQKKKQAKKNDYLAEAENWEEEASELEDGGIDYAAEAEQWEEVWGKEKKRKGLFFLRNPFGGLFGGFANLNLKLRMVIVFSVLVVLGGAAHAFYNQATAHVLVPKKKINLRSNEEKMDPDDLMKKAIDKFKDAIPSADQ